MTFSCCEYTQDCFDSIAGKKKADVAVVDEPSERDVDGGDISNGLLSTQTDEGPDLLPVIDPGRPLVFEDGNRSSVHDVSKPASRPIVHLPDCLFCAKVVENRPDKILDNSDNVVVFHDINPRAEVHLLAIPRSHIKSVDQLLPSDVDLLLEMRDIGFRALRKIGKDPQEASLVFHCPPFNSVMHLHLHFVINPEKGYRYKYELSPQYTWVRSFNQQLDMLAGRSVRRLGFDFDGVLHTTVGRPDGKDHRHPTTRDYLLMVPFVEIIERIKQEAAAGAEIYIITAQYKGFFEGVGRHFLSRPEVNLADIIPASRRIENKCGIQKVQVMKELSLDEFYDDSGINIKAVQEAVRKGELKPGFRVFQAFPEKSAKEPHLPSGGSIVDVTPE